MSQKLGPRNVNKKILGRPLTVGEFLDVMGTFERQTERKIWEALPWWKKLIRKARAKRIRQSQSRTTRSKTGSPATAGGERKTPSTTEGSGAP